jgi:hypothetical protein
MEQLVQFVARLQRVCRDDPTLTTWKRQWDVHDWGAFVDALGRNTQIRAVYLCRRFAPADDGFAPRPRVPGLRLPPTVARALARLMAKKQWDVFDVDNWPLSADGLRFLAAEAANGSVTRFVATNCNLGPPEAVVLSPLVFFSATLTVLDVRCNSICAAGAQTLANTIAVNSTLVELDMSCNSIGDAGATALAAAAVRHPTLTVLKLAKNGILDPGARALADAVRGGLAVLDLWGNAIGDAGAADLGTALAAGGRLTTLVLCRNYIHDTGAEALGAGAGGSHTLTTLDLEGNDICSRGLAALARAAATSTTLTTLHCIRADTSEPLQTALARNQRRLEYRTGILALVLAGHRQSPCLRLPAELWEQVVFADFLLPLK